VLASHSSLFLFFVGGHFRGSCLARLLQLRFQATRLFPLDVTVCDDETFGNGWLAVSYALLEVRIQL